MDAPTPRVDAMALHDDCGGGSEYEHVARYDPDGLFVYADDARQLERDLTAERAAHEATRAKLAEYRQAAFVATDMDRDDPQDIVRFVETGMAQLEMLTADRDQNAAALDRAVDELRDERARGEAMRGVLNEQFDAHQCEDAECKCATCKLARRAIAAGEAGKETT